MAPKRKGMSAEEKRRVILGIYHSTKDVYNLKEIESAASKLGVVQQSVKEMNQSLVDDHLVDSDKIASGVFFWSFPGKALTQKRAVVGALEKEITKLTADVAALEAKAEALSAGRKQSEERTAMMSEYQAAVALKAEQLKELQQRKDNDPAKIDKLQADLKVLKEGVNRWTDNVFAVKKHCTRKFGMPAKDVDRFIGIKDDFDYVE